MSRFPTVTMRESAIPVLPKPHAERGLLLRLFDFFTTEHEAKVGEAVKTSAGKGSAGVAPISTRDQYTDNQVLSALRNLRPTEFELSITSLFSRLGYDAHHNGGLRDGGVDVIAQKNSMKYFIQCKKYIRRRVTVEQMRAFYGAVVDRLDGGQAVFISTNNYTVDAVQFAQSKGIQLHGKRSIAKIFRLHGDLEQLQLANPTERNWTCSDCGSKLVERDSSHGVFIGCSNYPKCRHTENS